jgi:hypothetical protein
MQDDKCRAPAGQVGNVVLLAEVGGQRDWDLLQSSCQPHHRAMTCNNVSTPSTDPEAGRPDRPVPWRSQLPGSTTTNRKEPHHD